MPGLKAAAPAASVAPRIQRLPAASNEAAVATIAPHGEIAIERLPAAVSEPVGHPEDKVTAAQPWRGQISILPLPSIAQSSPPPKIEAPPVSVALAAVLRQAEEHTRQGVELGSRRAYYSAREEFVRSLGMIAQALDAEQRTTRHAAALAAGLQALEESDDFARAATAISSEANVQEIAARHHTPVVRESTEPLTPLSALQLYYTFAQQQLADSVDHHRAGSTALASLGKLYTVAASDPTSKLLSPEPKAMTLHQAALVVDAQNAVAANELGVTLARYGRYEDALAWLQHSVAIAPQQATWHNLAVVHQNLGQAQLAEAARRRQLAAAPTGSGRISRAPDVRWVSTSEFAAAGSGVVEAAPSPAPTGAAGNSRSATAPAETDRVRQTMGNRPRIDPPHNEPMLQ